LLGWTNHLANTQDAQQMAGRWSEKKDVAQISCFFSSKAEVTEDTIQSFEYSLKNEVPISEYPVNSVHKVLWTCPTCHGDYLYRMCDREIGDDSCPYCRHKKILSGFNSFEDTDPDLAKEWSSDNPDLPSEYMKSSWYRALWTCPTCHGNYFYRICDREVSDD